MQRLEKQSGGFGCYLFMAHDWADRERTKKSYELFAQYVMPAVNEESKRRGAPSSGHGTTAATFMPKVGEAIMNSIQSPRPGAAGQGDEELGRQRCSNFARTPSQPPS